MTSRVLVDSTRCEGHAQCVMEAPSIFELDDDGYASVLVPDVEGDNLEIADHAARACPAAAIALQA